MATALRRWYLVLETHEECCVSTCCSCVQGSVSCTLCLSPKFYSVSVRCSIKTRECLNLCLPSHSSTWLHLTFLLLAIFYILYLCYRMIYCFSYLHQSVHLYNREQLCIGFEVILCFKAKYIILFEKWSSGRYAKVQEQLVISDIMELGNLWSQAETYYCLQSILSLCIFLVLIQVGSC